MKRCPSCNTINLDSSLSCVRCKEGFLAAEARASSVSGNGFARVAARDFHVSVDLLKRVSFALVYADASIVKSLKIKNHSKEAARDILIKVSLSQEYGEPFLRSVPEILPGQSFELSGKEIILPLHKDRFMSISECERAALKVEILEDQEVRYANTWPIEMLPYNEWIIAKDSFQLLAQYVQPSQASVQKILSKTRDQMQNPSLSGYQEGPQKVLEISEALYQALEEFEITYINPPPSFDGQRIRSHDDVLKHARGTCLDLALLIAACFEGIGLHALVPIFEGHAAIGLWLGEFAFQSAWVPGSEFESFLDREAEQVFLFNSTTFASRPKAGIKESVAELEACMQSMCLLGVVDIKRAREERILPLP
jgi:hypothetical protein